VSDPRKYVILIGPTPDGGFGAWAPDLPGCVALGDTIEETEREMREAIAFHIKGLARTASRSRSRPPSPPLSSR
jgi:predicted RNase H-like HicB family nuclease